MKNKLNRILTVSVEFNENTTRERFMEVLGDSLYAADKNLLAPLDETEGKDYWSYDGIKAYWKVEEKND